MSVYLCFVCLLAQRSKPAGRCFSDMLTSVETVLNQTSDLESLNCSLYTPTPHDYQNCPSAVLKCFAEEIKVLVEEWQIVVLNDETSSPPSFRSLKNLKYGLQRLTKSSNQVEFGCTQCELFEEKKADLFLGELHSTLQMMCA